MKRNIMVVQQYSINQCDQCPFYRKVDSMVMICDKKGIAISEEDACKKIAHFCPLITGIVYFDERNLFM